MWEAVENIPKVLDGLASGVIIFVYNLIIALLLPLVSPIRGIAKLNHYSARHLSSRTSLLVAAMAIYGQLYFGFNTVLNLDSSVEKPTLIDFAISTLILYVCADLLSLGFTQFVARRRKRRHRAAELLRFAMASSLALCALFEFFIMRLPDSWLDRLQSARLHWLAYILYPLVSLTFYPLVIVLWELRRQPTIVFRLASIAVILVFFVMIQFTDAGSLGLSQEEPLPSIWNQRLLEASCSYKEPQELVIDAAIYNGSNTPVIVDDGSLVVVVKKTSWVFGGPKSGTTRVVTDQLAQIEPPYPVINPGDIGQARFHINMDRKELDDPNAMILCSIRFQPQAPSLGLKSGMLAMPPAGEFEARIWQPSESQPSQH